MARIVVVKNRLPYPPTTGTDVVTFNFLRALAARHDVTLVSLIVAEDQRRHAADFAAVGVRLVPVLMPNKKSPFHRAAYKLVYAALAWLSASPRDLWYYNPPAFRRAARDAARGADLVQFEYWFLYPTASAVRGVKKVLLQHDAEFNANRRLVAVAANPILKLARWWTYIRRRAFETAACGRFDEVLCLSAADAELLKPYAKKPPRVVFPVVDLPPPEKTCRGFVNATLIYFGGTRRPANHHGLKIFLEKIYPLIRRNVPGVRLVIMGERPRAGLRRRAAADPSVTIKGPAARVGDELAQAAVAVVPLWVGSGIKIKILTAFAYGLPVVTTPVGAEGIAARDGGEFLVAENYEGFAAAVGSLLTDRGRWEAVGAAARRFAERELSPAARDAAVADLYAELAAP